MNTTNNSKIVRTVISFSAAATIGALAYGGVPLNNLQGTGGIAFNPLAYTAGLPWDGDGGGNSTNAVEKTDSALNGVVSRPQIGAWYVNLNDAGINWWAASAAISFADRLEISGGYGFINAHKYGDKSINTYNIGAKLKFLDENAFDTTWVPALAVGGVWKYTDSRTVEAFRLDDNGFDAYVVASKLITQTPVPVLLSAGLLLSDEVVNGVVGSYPPRTSPSASSTSRASTRATRAPPAATPSATTTTGTPMSPGSSRSSSRSWPHSRRRATRTSSTGREASRTSASAPARSSRSSTNSNNNTNSNTGEAALVVATPERV